MPFTPIKATPEILAALEAEHEEILHLQGTERAPWTVVLRRPKRQETIGYKAHAKRDSTTANEQLIRKIAVFPDAAGMDVQFERWPFLGDGIADHDGFKDFLGLSVGADLK